MTEDEGLFSTDTEGLPEAGRPEVVRLRDGESHEITINPVRKRINEAEVRMLGYNGSIPGPTLHVDQGSTVTIEATNLGDVDATLHWHGLRLENRFDGVPEDTQAPIEHGDSFTYQLQFPDPGFYWYHPHIREDFAQEMGLYAGIIVEPSDPDYWAPADRQLAVTLDDVLIEDGQMAPFSRSGPSFTAMGRFGNVMLVNGETDYRQEARAGEVVRLHLVNTANTRIFNFGVTGARMKLVGGDSGRVEREEFVAAVRLPGTRRCASGRRKEAIMKKATGVFVAVGAVFAARPVMRRVGQKAREHCEEMASQFAGTSEGAEDAPDPRLREHCRQMAAKGREETASQV